MDDYDDDDEDMSYEAIRELSSGRRSSGNRTRWTTATTQTRWTPTKRKTAHPSDILHAEDEYSCLEVYVYDRDEGALFVHHDIALPRSL